MEVRFYIDPVTDALHIHNHGVSEQDVLDVLEFPGEDRPGRDGTRVALGQTSSGRCLRVIYVTDQERDGIFVITAYQLTGKPLAAWRKRRKRKHQ
ncbi:MAG: DUF4258 domain-containing protein [Acidobacteriia bacterium]|nr:DUF4258 domain-containing protein [Terriglobia bacterium]